MNDVELAAKFHAATSAAALSPLAAEPEAQLTAPVKDLFERVGSTPGKLLMLIREAQLDGIRPDFGALLNGQPCGWIELKAPGKSLDGSRWRGREAKQWQLLSQLDSLVVCNGSAAQLYSQGTPVGPNVALPLHHIDGWTSAPLRSLLLQFASARPSPIRRVSELAERLAPLARLLRDRIVTVLTSPTESALRKGKQTWAAHIHDGVDDREFANDLSQVIAYSMAIAALRGGADLNNDKLIELDEARQAIEGTSPVLSAALGPVLGVKGLLAEIRHEVSAIERLASAVDPVAIAASTDPRGEPWLWFYEDFLHTFDPVARQKAGVYYTPTDVVQHQVRAVQDILRIKFKRKLGFADRSVVTLDPACGSGTYPLAIIDAAASVAFEQRGPAGPSQVASTLARNLISFELMPGPYAVAHLRIGQRIAEAAGKLVPSEVRVYLTDTLDDPHSIPQTLPLWGDADILAEERRRAQSVKREEEVMVAIGNPPYDRVSQGSGAGGWVVNAGNGRTLFADILEPATASTRFSHIASLYNLYVYFWRWAIWKTFESSGDGPAIVSFITASSWLTGPGFVGLRQLVQSLGDEVWICDLGGNNRGTRTEENVFAIETPVAIVTILRDLYTNHNVLPRVLYKKIDGTRSAKLRQVGQLESPLKDSTSWTTVALTSKGQPMVPPSGGLDWQVMPPLAQLFPWQYPGVKVNRTWPIAPSRGLLEKRWRALLALQTADERAAAFITPATGRNIHTKVRGLPPISSLQKDAVVPSISRYGFRSFDRQWILEDPRLIALDRPPLWASVSSRQIFMSTMITTPLGRGPAISVSANPPDLHHFRGSYGGKDTIPLYRDADAEFPNITKGLLGAVGNILRESDPRQKNPTAEDLAAYSYAMMFSPNYFTRYSEALADAGPRVPITRSSKLFGEVCNLGRELLWLHTFGERYNGRSRPDEVPRHSNVYWIEPVEALPDSISDVRFDANTTQLYIGAGIITGVRETAWRFQISGWPVLQRWLAYRTKSGYGKSATSPGSLDRIRPTSWDDDWNNELIELITVLTRTEELFEQHAALIDEVCDGPLITSDELPKPEAFEMKEPSA